IQGREGHGGANQNDNSSSLERIPEGAAQLRVKALLRRGLELNGDSFHATGPARFDDLSAHVARGDAEFAKGPVAFVAQIMRGSLGVVFAKARSDDSRGVAGIESRRGG